MNLSKLRFGQSSLELWTDELYQVDKLNKLSELNEMDELDEHFGEHLDAHLDKL